METPLNAVWQPRPLSPGQTLRYTLPPLRLFVSRTPEECRVAAQTTGESSNTVEPAGALPGDLTWRRSALPDSVDRVAVVPVLPDRPLIVRPADTISLVPGHRTSFFVSLPVWFRIEVAEGEGDPIPLMETPSLPLSKSWFGPPDSGEPCYALTTRARHGLDELTDTLNRAVCCLELHNRSGEPLLFERFCLRIPHLALYQSPDARLWCGDVLAVFEGADTPALVKHADTPPRHAAAAARLSPPRAPISGNLRDRAFSHIRSIVRTGI